MGENYHTYTDFKNILDCGGAAILNVNVAICPGYDVGHAVALLAQERDLIIAPHGCQGLQYGPGIGFELNMELLGRYRVL